MQIPSYQYIVINSDHKSNIFEQLQVLNFGKRPYLFDVTNLNDELSAITFIDEYIEQFNVALFPYPIFIITNQLGASKMLETFSGLYDCPQFFNQKSKNLSSAEQKLLTKLELKVNKLNTIKDQSYNENIKQYASKHKEIHSLTLQNLYLEKLLNRLE